MTLARMMCAALFVAVTVSPAAAEARRPRSALSMNPIELVNGLFSFEYESAPSPMFSLHAGMSFLVTEALYPNDPVTAYALGPEVGARLFLLGEAPQGLWLGPFGGISFVRGRKYMERSHKVGFSAGLMAGTSWILFDRMIVSAGAGVGYHDLATEMGDVHAGMHGWSPRMRLSAGMAF